MDVFRSIWYVFDPDKWNIDRLAVIYLKVLAIYMYFNGELWSKSQFQTM